MATSLGRADKPSCATGVGPSSYTTTTMGTTTASPPLDSIILTGALTAGLCSEMNGDQFPPRSIAIGLSRIRLYSMPDGLPTLIDRAYVGADTRQLVLDLGMIPVAPPKRRGG
jgi:hypothetical protein